MTLPTIQTLTAGSTYRFRPIYAAGDTSGALRKDGVAWDISGMTVNLLLKPVDGSGSQVTVAATVVSATAGTVYADWVAVPGLWSGCWEVLGAGSVPDDKPLPMQFTVRAAP